jgi:16S rRNA processing protein RimM
MNNYVEVGKIVNTHGIKGEVKVISNFEYKEEIFVKDFNLYIGINKIREVIASRRVHQQFDLICFKGINDINDVLKYKGNKIYVLRNDLNLGDDKYLYSDLIGFKVYDNDKYLGIVIDYDDVSSNNVLFKVKGEKDFYLPNISHYINKIDIANKRIDTNNGSDLIL